MSTKKYLEFSHDESAPWFDEGPVPRDVININTVNSGGIDTSAIDSWRQGVEITLMSHFNAGLGKISAGEPGHLLKQNTFGGNKSRTTTELVSYTPSPWYPSMINPLAWWRSDYGTNDANDVWQNTRSLMISSTYVNSDTITALNVALVWGFVGASSVTAITTDGYVEFTSLENTIEKMCGISVEDRDQSYESVEYALYLSHLGTVNVYESGTPVIGVGAYVAGDVFRIKVDGTVVTYWKNGTLLYTSLVAAINRPLRLDVALIKLSTIVLLGWGGTTTRVNSILDPWSTLKKVTATSTSLTCTNTLLNWESCATGKYAIPYGGNGHIDFSTNENNLIKGAGLSTDMAASGVYTNIDYLVIFWNTGVFFIIENGVDVTPGFLPYVAGDTITIQVSGTTVTYLKNGVLVYTSLTAVTGALFFSASLYDLNCTITNIVMSGMCPSVAEWINHINANNHMTQATAMQRPLLLTDGGLPVVRFTAANLSVLVASALPLTSDYTVFMVRRLRAPAAAWAGSWGNSPVTATNGMSDTQAANKFALAHNFVANAIWGNHDLNLTSCIWRYDFVNSLADLRLNSLDQIQTAEGNQITPTGDLTLGAVISNGNQDSDVDILEFAAWNRRLSLNEIDQLSSYVLKRYGV